MAGDGYQQGFRSVASFGFGGQESVSKPPQAICKPLSASFKMRDSMKRDLYIVLTLIIFSNCSHDKPANGNASAGDTIVSFNTLGEEEQFLWDYFQDIETQLEKDPEIKKENIP